MDYEGNPMSSDFILSYIDQQGAHATSHNAENHINQIIPENLHSYFFFNGERIEKLAHVSSGNDIQRAIKNLMGLEMVSRACLHLDKSVIKTLKKELKGLSSGDLAKIIEQESRLSEELDETRGKLSLANTNINEHKEELLLVKSKLAGIRETADLQKERDSLEATIKRISLEKKELVVKQRDYISRYGFLAFTKELVNDSELFLEDKRKKGELPFKVKEQFINDLLEAQQCICGRGLDEGGEPFDQVQKYKRLTTSSDIESAFITANGAISHIKEARLSLYGQLRSFKRAMDSMVGEIELMSGKIDVLTDKIGNIDVGDVPLMETKRGELDKNIEQFNVEKGALIFKKEELDKKLSELRNEREKLATQNEKEKIAKDRLHLAEEALRVIQSLYDSLGNAVRVELSSKVNGIFKKIIRKPYWAEISEDYILEIHKQVGEYDKIEYEKSTGENQVTSLSFIGSIVQMAKERQVEDNAYFKGGVYPIVMDSAYGSLDPEYRQKICEYIPKMAEQVVLMVSDSQWFGGIADRIRPMMGKEYSLIYHTPNPRFSNERVKKSIKYEYTNIEEGFYG